MMGHTEADDNKFKQWNNPNVEMILPRTINPIVILLRKKRESSVDRASSLKNCIKVDSTISHKKSDAMNFTKVHVPSARKDVPVGKIPTYKIETFEGSKTENKSAKLGNLKETGMEREIISVKRQSKAKNCWVPPHAVYSYKQYSIKPAKIEDYEPGKSSIALQEPQTIYSANFSVDKPGDHCKYTENDSDAQYLIQRPRSSNRASTPDLSGHKLYTHIQRGGEIPPMGLHHSLHSDKGTKILTRRKSDACLYYPRSKSEPHQNDKKHMKPCQLPPSPFCRFASPSCSVSLSALLSCASDDIKDRNARDEINSARKKEMEYVLKAVKEKRKMVEIEENEARRHSDVYRYLCNSPVSVDRYNFNNEEIPGKAGYSRFDFIKSKLKAKVLYNFHAKLPSELTLHKNDIVYIWRKIDANWFEGEHHGAVGLFPISYVKVLAPKNSESPVPRQTKRVKFDFTAQNGREITVKKNECVKVLNKIDENWLQVESQGRVGLLPLSFLEQIEDLVSHSDDIRDRKTGDEQSATESTNASGSLSTESLSKYGSVPHPSFTSPLTRFQLEKLRSTFISNSSSNEDNLNSPQKANKDAAELLPYVECIAIQSYRPQEVDELFLKQGDVIHVTEIFNDGWFVGISMRTKQCGTFPGICVRKL